METSLPTPTSARVIPFKVWRDEHSLADPGGLIRGWSISPRDGVDDFPTVQRYFTILHLHNQGWATGLATWYSRNVFSFTQPWEESYKLPLSPILWCTFWLAKKQYIQQTSPSPYTWATIELHNGACRRPDCKPRIRYLDYDMSTISYKSS
jgi:hypothetical protein